MEPDTGHGQAGRIPLILIDDRPRDVAAWVVKQLPYPFVIPGDFAAFGTGRQDGTIIGGFLLHSHRVPGDLEVMAAGIGRGWITRRLLRRVAGFVFEELGCHRATAVVSKRHKAARRMASGAGWREEGCLRHAMPDCSDAIVYGMLKRECRWI